MKINFGGVTEDIVTRKEFPLKKAQKVLKGKTVAVLGYGIQGPAQALNMRDNGIKVIVGQRKSAGKNSSWGRALADGWVPGKTLFSIEEAAEKGDAPAGERVLYSDDVPPDVLRRCRRGPTTTTT